MIIIFIKPNIMGSVDNKFLIWISVDINSCSSWISHEITLMWSIIKIISCNISIDDVYSHTPYFDVFVWKYFSMTEKLRNTTMQYILNLAGEPYGILICKTPKFFLVDWVQQKSSRNISKCLIRTLTFIIDRRCISTCSMNYDVHVMASPHEFRRSF